MDRTDTPATEPADKPLGPFRVPYARAPSAADKYREIMATDPRFKEAPKSGSGVVIVGHRPVGEK